MIELLEDESSEVTKSLLGSYTSEFASVLKIEAARQQNRSASDSRPRTFMVTDRVSGDVIRSIDDFGGLSPAEEVVVSAQARSG